MEKYCPSKDAQYPIFHAVAAYDVLNCVYTNAIFEPSPANERDLACKLLDEHDLKRFYSFDINFITKDLWC